MRGSTSRLPIGSLNTSETEIALMGAGLARGHVTSAPYFQSVDTPENAVALAGFRRRHGGVLSTDMNWEAGQKSFIAELMPKHPLYVDFLSPEARESIGQVHPHTAPARAI